MSPLVSIITPCYNAASIITETINSVKQQGYSNWELIIINDCSTDNSLEVISEASRSDDRIIILDNDINLKTAKTRNRGVHIARGDYIAFLDSDDTWEPSFLERQIGFMQEKGHLVSYSSYNIIDKDGNYISTVSVPPMMTYKKLLTFSYIFTVTLIYNAKVLSKRQFIDMRYEDYILKLELLKDVECAYGITEPLANYRVLENSYSSNKLKAAQWQWDIYREYLKLSFLKSIYYFSSYAVLGGMKYLAIFLVKFKKRTLGSFNNRR